MYCVHRDARGPRDAGERAGGGLVLSVLLCWQKSRLLARTGEGLLSAGVLARQGDFTPCGALLKAADALQAARGAAGAGYVRAVCRWGVAGGDGMRAIKTIKIA